jgi:glycoside/pentoside/hexuronide:cation symporter, GPH family
MSEPAPTPRLGLPTKVTYGLGAVAQGVGSVTLSTAVINYYLVSVVGLRPAVVGVVIMVSLIIDAVLDPLIGRWSDTFRSKWGRRHPFMYASTIPIAICTVMFWRHPAWISAAAMPVYVFTVLVVMRLAGGFYTIPSDALAPELAPDYHERTTLISWRWAFGVVGGLLLTILLNGVFLRRDAANPLGQNNAAGYASFGIAAAVIAVSCIVISALSTQRYVPLLQRPPVRHQSTGEAAREIFKVLSNPSLLAIMASGVVSGVAGGVTESLRNFMSYDFWGLTPQVIALMTVAIAPASLIGVIAAPLLSRALDKKRTMITVFTLSIFAGVVPVSLRLLGLLPPNGSWVIPVVLTADVFVAAALGITGFVIVGSMIADVVEDAAVKTGVRAEGLLFATNGLLPKFTTGAGILLGNMMLEFVHFPAAGQAGRIVAVAPGVMHELALLQLPIGAILNLVAVAVLFFYRIDRGSHEANLEALRLAATITEPPIDTIGGPAIPDPSAIVT